MYKSLLVRIFGFPATLFHGDTLVLDRWRWLKRRLPQTNNGERLLDVGCGTGAFTIGAALRGYTALGVSWDERNQAEAERRAKICGASRATFRVCDVRELDQYHEYREAFDVVVCTENIEHILDDSRLVRSITTCLKPGGRLLLTTPNFYFRAMTKSDNGPFCETETGGHVRRGYTRSMLTELTDIAGLNCEEFSYCSGMISQLVTRIMRQASRIHPLLGWAIVLPLRPFTILDQLFAGWTSFPPYSVCLEAYKPRWPRRRLESVQNAIPLERSARLPS